MHFAIYGRASSKELPPMLPALIEKLNQEGHTFTMYDAYAEYISRRDKTISIKESFKIHEDLKSKVDFMISLGGDGTLLDTVSLVRDSGIPVMGINTGRLGFLAATPHESSLEAISSLIKGHYSLDNRSLIELETNKGIFGENRYALNELTIHKKDTSSMVTIHAYLNGEYLNSYWADGLIISTPTGSTGYSLSCGGPIVAPQSTDFVITPIAPHNLNVRPIVVADKNVISLEVEGRSSNFLAALDSRSVTIDASVHMAVRKAPFELNLVRLNNQNFLSTLREKLMWGKDSRN